MQQLEEMKPRGAERSASGGSTPSGSARGDLPLGEGAGEIAGEGAHGGRDGGFARDPHIPAIARLSGTETWAPRAEQWDASRFNPHLASDEGRGRIPPSLEELIARKDNWRANNRLSHCPWDSVPACCKEGHLKLNQKGRSEIQKRVGECAVRGDRGLPTDRRLEQSRAREALEIKRTLFCSLHDHSFECNDSDSEIVADALNLEVPCSQSEHSVSQSPHDTSENLTVD